MESLELLEKLKKAIESDVKVLSEENKQEREKYKRLQEQYDELSGNLQEARDSNSSLQKKIKDLKEKYGRLHDKLKKKQEEVHKKEKWWEKYRLTAETTLKKVRMLGTFPPDALQEVRRDLVDIMEDNSSTETVSSQDEKPKKPLKRLSITKENKKFRYEEVSPENDDSSNKNQQQKRHFDADVSETIKSTHDSFSESNVGSKKEVHNDNDCETTNVETISAPSLTSTPVFSSTQSKISPEPINFPDFSLIANENIPSDVNCNLFKSKFCKVTGKSNIRIAIEDIRKSDSKKIKAKQNNCERNITSSNAQEYNENDRGSPSILPKESDTTTANTRKVINDKKRISSSSSSIVNVKRLKKDSDPGSSIVLLSSDEEDDRKLGSSIDMFGEDDKSVLNSKEKDFTCSTETSSKNDKTQSTLPFSKSEEANPKAKCDDFDDYPDFGKTEKLLYKHIEVVRKKDERIKLKGFSCRECAEYYGSLNLNEEDLKKRLKQCSRHRAKHSPPPATPPGFWNLSFPSTQEYMEKGMLKTGEYVPKPSKRKSRRKRLLGKDKE